MHACMVPNSELHLVQGFQLLNPEFTCHTFITVSLFDSPLASPILHLLSCMVHVGMLACLMLYIDQSDLSILWGLYIRLVDGAVWRLQPKKAPWIQQQPLDCCSRFGCLQEDPATEKLQSSNREEICGQEGPKKICWYQGPQIHTVIGLVTRSTCMRHLPNVHELTIYLYISILLKPNCICMPVLACLCIGNAFEIFWMFADPLHACMHAHGLCLDGDHHAHLSTDLPPFPRSHQGFTLLPSPKPLWSSSRCWSARGKANLTVKGSVGRMNFSLWHGQTGLMLVWCHVAGTSVALRALMFQCTGSLHFQPALKSFIKWRCRLEWWPNKCQRPPCSTLQGGNTMLFNGNNGKITRVPHVEPPRTSWFPRQVASHVKSIQHAYIWIWVSCIINSSMHDKWYINPIPPLRNSNWICHRIFSLPCTDQWSSHCGHVDQFTCLGGN